MTLSSRLQSHRILIVDDNPSIHNDFRKILNFNDRQIPDLDSFELTRDQSLDSIPVQSSLSSPELRIDSAFQGIDALQMAASAVDQKDAYSLAFVDMRMPPGIDGLQTIEQLWQISPELQVVLCTAYSDRSWEDVFTRLGRKDNLLILKKPFDDVEVLQLAAALTCKWEMTRDAQVKHRHLERLVHDRTADLEHAALHDPLTGLANRLKFDDRLCESLRTPQGNSVGSAVLLVDLDHFKSINDLMGHPAGDELICAVAKRLCSAVDNGGLVARFGGDEFAIVCDVQCDQEIALLVTKIQAAISEPVILGDQTITISASVGIAVSPNDGRTAIELVRNADVAMYRAKHDGRDCARFFEAIMDQQLRERRRLEQRLRDAVQYGRFVLYFQPLVVLETNRICAFEALLRWDDPDLGIVCPDKFIPLAEETGLIRTIGSWVLLEAC